MFLLVSGILLFFAFLSMEFVWSFKKNTFMEKEAKRCLSNQCEVDDEWSSIGRIYTRGFTVIRENGKNKFIKQAKICGPSLLE